MKLGIYFYVTKKIASQYILDSEEHYRATQSKKGHKILTSLHKGTMEKSIKIKINGKVYSSLSNAALGVGVSQTTMKRWYKEISSSSRSSIEKEARVLREFEISLVREE